MANIVSGDIIVDDRGSVRFVNDFDFKNVKRFYQVQNHNVGQVRAWEGAKHEDKYLYVPSGSALVGAVNLDTNEVQKFVMSAEKPRVLWIPANSASGFKVLEENTILFFFSSYTEAESKGDHIQFPADKWNIWE